jgi:hypothetical protein
MLKVFHCGYPTLSRLLKAMRHVRYIVDGDAEFLRSLSCKCEDRDPFTHLALQRRMNRYFDVDDVRLAEALKNIVRFYYSDESIRRREGRGTLMDFCVTAFALAMLAVVSGDQRIARALKKAFGPETTAVIPPTSSLRPRTPNGAPIHQVQQVAKTRLFRLINGRAAPPTEGPT